jgi:hypothetical protein
MPHQAIRGTVNDRSDGRIDKLVLDPRPLLVTSENPRLMQNREVLRDVLLYAIYGVRQLTNSRRTRAQPSDQPNPQGLADDA